MNLNLIIFLATFFAVFIFLIIFCVITIYLKKKKEKNETLIIYGLSELQQKYYTDAANRCKKYNYPVTDVSFSDLVLEGAELIIYASYNINDYVVEGSEYHVI